MYKLVVSDLDGTLLDECWQISPRDRHAILAAAQQGVRFTLATGRMTISARRYAKELGLDLPMITYHGALVAQGLSGNILYRKVIPSPLAAELTAYLLKQGIYTQIYIKDRVFVQELNDYSAHYVKMSGVQVEQEDLLDILAKEPEGLEKIMCEGHELVLERTREELAHSFGEYVHITSSTPQFLDIIDKSVSKGTALEALAARWGIASDEIVAIGDGLNDLEMIRFAGLGVAMGNARSELKQAADYVTATNGEAGVAQVIEKFILKH